MALVSARYSFTPAARLGLPAITGLPITDLESGDIFWNRSTETIHLRLASSWLALPMSVAVGVAGGLSVAETNSRYTFSVDATVLRTTGDFSFAGALSLTSSGTMNCAAGSAVYPVATTFPVTGNVEGRYLWRSDIKGLYVYDSLLSSFVNIFTASGVPRMSVTSQSSPSAAWSINHGLNTTSVYPFLTDGGNPAQSIEWNNYQIVDNNNIIVNLLSAFSGKAFVLGV